MKKTGISFLLAGLFTLCNIRADEGMWLLPLLEELNISIMQEMGLKLSADQIYNINTSSLKDAIGALDYGSCTAELISPDGLLLTNHHCGFDEIQYHSSVEHDYLTDGFWAMIREEELPNPGKTISFLIRMDDISDVINLRLNDRMTESERQEIIAEISDSIENEAINGTHYEASIVQFFGGNKFYLIITETYLDVRLVGAPPESIGKFGHDTDNWIWPRHTGDFTLFRVYTGPDGKPAEYAPENIPLKPRNFLTISLKGIQKNDFAMVIGYPGITNRYMTSWEIEQVNEIDNPNRIKIRGLRQDLMMEDMLSSNEIRIKYASKYSTSSNYWKYSIGQNEGIKNLDLINRQKHLENQFLEWVNADQERTEKYGQSFDLVKNAVLNNRDYHHARQYILEALLSGIEFINFSASFFQLFMTVLEYPDDPQAIGEVIESMQRDINDFFKDYNAATDKKVTLAMLQLFSENVKQQFHPDFFATISIKYKGNFEKYVDKVFKKSMFVDRNRLNMFLESPDIRMLQKDPAFGIAISVYRKYFEIDDQYNYYQENLNRGHRLYIAGLTEMQKDRKFYPDANSTMRLSYGRVGDYQARDAVHYEFYTSLTGVMEKEDPDNPEFVVDERLKQLYQSKDYGRYGMGDIMPVCFTTNNDITGGNSGSPVLNAGGELIGIAFDGNWEAMSSDLAFEPELQKCINVDIRYVLFIMDKFAGATHLIEEMIIVE
ncbi:MAG: peptidase S46 [Bacteroides sp. SM23_62_1]|nr:MAG: peptidase S46 [Bacteroides sp. SM23_62_1]